MKRMAQIVCLALGQIVGAYANDEAQNQQQDLQEYKDKVCVAEEKAFDEAKSRGEKALRNYLDSFSLLEGSSCLNEKVKEHMKLGLIEYQKCRKEHEKFLKNEAEYLANNITTEQKPCKFIDESLKKKFDALADHYTSTPGYQELMQKMASEVKENIEKNIEESKKEQFKLESQLNVAKAQKEIEEILEEEKVEKKQKVSTTKRLVKKGLALGSYGLINAATWYAAYKAWYEGRTQVAPVIRSEGGFGPETYAGGADKLGHFYSNYLFNRIGQKLLKAGGFEPVAASVVSSVITLAFFTAIEYKDAVHAGFGFSISDMVANVSGNVLALILENSKNVDECVGFGMTYKVSQQFKDSLKVPGNNIGEDYSGMKWYLHFNVYKCLNNFVPSVRDSLPAFRPLKYLRFGVGYNTLGYKPNYSFDEEGRPIGGGFYDTKGNPVRHRRISGMVMLDLGAVFEDIFGKHWTTDTATLVQQFVAAPNMDFTIYQSNDYGPIDH